MRLSSTLHCGDSNDACNCFLFVKGSSCALDCPLAIPLQSGSLHLFFRGATRCGERNAINGPLVFFDDDAAAYCVGNPLAGCGGSGERRLQHGVSVRQQRLHRPEVLQVQRPQRLRGHLRAGQRMFCFVQGEHRL